MRIRALLAASAPLFLFVGLEANAAGAGPVAKLQDVSGTVEFSRGGEDWKLVTRTKYLFAGYQVRTGDDSSASLLNQTTGQSQALGANAMVRINEGGFEVVKGQLGAAESETGSFWQALANKFSRAQRYTTVRRGKVELCKAEAGTNITVAASHRELVWANAGPDCSYRLQIDGKTHEIPVASTAEMVRFTLPELAPGEHQFVIENVQNGEVKHKANRPSKLKWLSAEEAAVLVKEEQQLREQSGGDQIVLAAFYEDKGLKVAAMDAYRAYMAENPEDVEMRALLAKAYADLKLDELRNGEALAFQSAGTEAPAN